jgi:basic membrane protein A
LLGLGGCQRPAPEAAQQSSAAAQPSPAGAGALKVAFVYVGPVGDGGWTYAHDQARRNLEAEYGDRVQTSYVENVPEGSQAEQVFRDLAKAGNRLIFGTTYGYGEAMRKVAAEFPDVKFEHATGDRTAANIAVYEARTYEGAYLAGILAAKVTKKNKLGFVASIPIPEVFRNINAFTLGAQSINPDITTELAWVGQWFDPDKERAVALELIARGADVLIQNTDSAAVLRAAQEKGVHAFGWDSDMTRYAPRAHLGSVAIDWAPYYKKAVADLLAERWQAGAVWWGVRQNMIRIASPQPALPHELLLYLGEKSLAIRGGALRPFAGPIVDRDGQQVIGAGASLDDAALKSMRFLVRGVAGKIPA